MLRKVLQMVFARKVLNIVLKPRYGVYHLALCVAILGAFMLYTVLQTKAAVFQSPLPDIRVAPEAPVPDSTAYQREYEFTTNWFSHNIPVWQKVFAPFKGKPDLRYLEIGVYEGRSAIWMLENVLTHPTARLTGIDIFEGPYKDRYLANLERSGSSDKATTVTGYSQLALRELPFNSFDIIYIDGSHAKDDVLEDAVLCWRLLKDGGVLIFDDYRWCGIFILGTSDSFGDSCKPAIEPFVQCFDRHFEVIHNSYQLIVRKRQNDAA